MHAPGSRKGSPSLAALRGRLSRRKPFRRARPAQINVKNRFDSRAGAALNADEITFGTAGAAYLRKRAKAGWTCGEVLDVLMNLGYRNRNRDFKACVHTFTLAVSEFKRRGRRPFPTWGRSSASLRSAVGDTSNNEAIHGPRH